MLSYDVYPQRDGSAKYWIKQQLRGVVLANQMPDVHAVAVLSLLEAAGLLDLLFTRDEYRSARKRTGRIIESMELRRAERSALDEVCAAVNALVGSLKK